jgi:hypothetical protein
VNPATAHRELGLSLRRQPKAHRQHNAAAGQDTDVVATGDGGLTGGVERISVSRAVGRDRLGKSRTSDFVAGDAVLVEEVIEAQSEFRLIEASACPQGVVQEGIHDGKRTDNGLVMIGAVVLVDCADALVEHAEIPAFMLIGDTFSFDVGGGVGDPQTGGSDDVDLRG